MANNKFINAQKVADEIGVSKSYAYKIVQQLNKELKEKGILTVSGKVNRKYFMERFGYPRLLLKMPLMIALTVFMVWQSRKIVFFILR